MDLIGTTSLGRGFNPGANVLQAGDASVSVPEIAST